jgi:hypothetical protein
MTSKLDSFGLAAKLRALVEEKTRLLAKWRSQLERREAYRYANRYFSHVRVTGIFGDWSPGLPKGVSAQCLLQMLEKDVKDARDYLGGDRFSVSTAEYFIDDLSFIEEVKPSCRCDGRDNEQDFVALYEDTLEETSGRHCKHCGELKITYRPTGKPVRHRLPAGNGNEDLFQ